MLQNETAAFRPVDGVNRPPCDEDFDSACGRFEASICSRHGYLHPELLESLSPCLLAVLTSKIAQFREDFWAATFEPRSYRRKQKELAQEATKDTRDGGPTRRDRSNIAVARFLDMPRRIAQERVPTASNIGSRDVTWASPAHTSHPLSRLFYAICQEFLADPNGAHGFKP